MRSEAEMFALILNIARENEHIRAVYMNGSRANPGLPKDKYQDYDIVYVVDCTTPFLTQKDWIAAFGDIALLQEPDRNDHALGMQRDFSQSYTWLMLFCDGTRIDLRIMTKNKMQQEYCKDSLTVPLLDKDNCLPDIAPANDSGYHIQRPTPAQYYGATNNFWWCLQNVAKGIARDQLTYAMNMYLQVVHEALEQMLSWYIGMQNNFSVNVGLWGKYYHKYLLPEEYGRYVQTYSDGNYENLWRAVFTSCELFHDTAVAVGAHLGYAYRQEEEDGMLRYLSAVRADTQ